MPYGVTNSFKRGTFRTYTRHAQHASQVHDTDSPRKRIRMDEDGTVIEENFNLPDEDPPALAPESRIQSSSTVPSSPPPADLDDLTDPTMKENGTESPPSSPPPRLPSPETTSTKPAFSFLKRKRSLRSSRQVSDSSDSQPLANIAPNVQPELPRPAKKARLTQMQIDLGGRVQKTCKTCGMEYIPSNKEDAALHKEFHAMNIGGVDVGKKFQSSKDLKKAYPRDKRWLNEGEDMVMVDRKSPLWAKQKASKIMEVVNTELGSARINDDDLWAPLPPTTERAAQTTRKKKDTAGPENGSDRFKAFLHLEGEKCVGFCLVEKISGARRVVDPETEEDSKAAEDVGLGSSSISVSTDTDVVLLGIARIWTSKSHRGRGIAKELLEAARGNFFYGLEVRKDLIAFSQPTESGGKLAEKWFGSKTGWRVYGEQR